MVQARNHPDARQFTLPGLLLKFPASYLHSSRETGLRKHAICCPPPVQFRYESAPGGNISPQMPPYGHRVGFGCMGGTPSAALLAQTPKLGGTPHTYKTNPVAIRGYVWAHITPRGRLIPKTHRGRMFHKPGVSLLLWR